MQLLVTELYPQQQPSIATSSYIGPIIHLLKAHNIPLSTATQRQILSTISSYAHTPTSTHLGGKGDGDILAYEFFECVLKQAEEQGSEVDQSLWDLFVTAALAKKG